MITALLEHVQAALEVVDALLGAAAVDLQLGLAGAAPADAAGEPRHRGAVADHARQEVAQLGQLDLQLAVRGGRVLGEDVEDQGRAVDDLELGVLADLAGLRGREVGVADQELDVLLERPHEHVAQLALTEEGARVGAGAALGSEVDQVQAGGAAQLAQLLLACDQLGAGALMDHQGHRAQTRRLGAGSLGRGDEVGLEVADVRQEVGRHVRRGQGMVLVVVAAEHAERHARESADDEHVGAARRRRGEAGEVDLHAGRAAVDRGDEIEAQLGEVGELLAGQRVGHEVRDDQTNAAQTAALTAYAREFREREAVGVAQDHALDPAAAIDEQAELAVEHLREVEQVAGEHGRDDVVGRDLARAEALQRPRLAALEIRGVAVDGLGAAHGESLSLLPSRTRRATAIAC